jgi:mannosyltransferase
MILILILAVALRLWGLGSESLWLDEALTWQKLSFSPLDFVTHFAHETQTILYYGIEKVWSRVVGTSEWALRFPSVIYGLAAVLGTFLLTRALFSAITGLYAALLMAVNPFAIFYSQETRPYELFLAAAVFSCYYVLRVLRDGTRRSHFGYVVSTTIALYSHPLAPLLWGVHASALLLRDVRELNGWNAARRLGKVMALSALLFLPQVVLISGMIVAKTKGVSPASWIPVPPLYAFRVTLQQYFMHPLLALVVVLMIAGVGLAHLIQRRRLPSALWIPAALVIFCMLAPWLISHVITPVYVDRYTIPALAGFVIALAWALSEMGRWLRAVALALLMGLTALALYGYYTGLDKDPWRQTAEDVRALVKPGDLIAVTPNYTLQPFLYYYHPPQDVTVTAPWSLWEIPAAVDTNARVIVVKSYDEHPSVTIDELCRRAAQGRVIVSEQLVAENEKRNPYLYWMSPIRVTVYETMNDE